jgi:hypothetical protein
VRLAFLTAAFGLSVAAPFAAQAQHCRAVPSEPESSSIEADLRAEAATYRTTRFEGSYEGLFLGAGFRAPLFALRMQLPRYRIVKNGLPQHGFGDLLGEAQLRVLQLREPTLRFGLALAITLPTGNRHAELGMGHAMWIPSVWADVTRSRFQLQAKLSYAGVFDDEAGHRGHARGPAPIVAPMNVSELGTLLSGSARVVGVIHLRLSAFSAIALNDAGASRATALFATDFLFQKLRFTLEAELPLLGDPFLFKLASEAGIRF